MTSIGSGRYFGLALTSTGTTWGWGYNYYGELGDGATTGSKTGQLSPTQTKYNSVQGGASTTASYTYNGDGLRMSKTVGTTTTNFTWDPSAATPLLLTDGTNYYIYGPGNLPVEEITPTGNYYYYHHDRLGSTRLLTDSSGNIAATYTYDPYGNTTATTGTVTNPLRYAGAYTDPETGLIYLTNRYYDPSTGQFLNVDPLVGLTHAPYSYAADNPVNNTDPSGLYCNKLPAGAIGPPECFPGPPGAGQVYSPDQAYTPAPPCQPAVSLGPFGPNFPTTKDYATWLYTGGPSTPQAQAQQALNEYVGVYPPAPPDNTGSVLGTIWDWTTRVAGDAIACAQGGAQGAAAGAFGGTIVEPGGGTVVGTVGGAVAGCGLGVVASEGNYNLWP